jgi:hypothetical protein
MLLEQEIEGLMRQSYLYATKTPGQRALDYSSLIILKRKPSQPVGEEDFIS